MPRLAAAVKRDLAVDGNRYELVALGIFELHNLMTGPRQFSPSAWLLRILFDRLILVTCDRKSCGPQLLLTGAADRDRLPFNTYRPVCHQL